MRVTDDNLKLLDTTFNGYLEDEAVNAFFDTYGINFLPGTGARAGSATGSAARTWKSRWMKAR